MKYFTNLINGIRKIKNQEDLSVVLEKVTEVVDNKLVEMKEEQENNQLDPVIIKDENDNFIDCCNVIKPDSPDNYIALASFVLNGLKETEKTLRFQLKRFAVVFYTILMLFYTIFNISHINNFGNRFVSYSFLGLFAILFIIMTVVNILIYKNTKIESSGSQRHLKIMKNYKSIAVILRRIMLLWSLSITIYSMIITWDEGPAYQFLNILMLIITTCILFYIIYREIKKIQKRSMQKEDGKFKTFFTTAKDTFKNSKTADMLSTGNLKLEEAKHVEESQFKKQYAKRKDSANAKKQVKRNSYELKKAYKEKYKKDLRELKESYLDTIDKL